MGQPDTGGVYALGTDGLSRATAQTVLCHAVARPVYDRGVQHLHRGVEKRFRRIHEHRLHRGRRSPGGGSGMVLRLVPQVTAK